MRFQETTFRPLFGRILSVVIGVLGVASIVVTFFEADLGLTLRTASVVGLVVVLTFAGFWFPGVAVREEAVEVRNVFTTSVVPWGAIRRIDTKWALALTTDRGTVNAWASPAPGRYATLSMTKGDVRRAADSGRAAEGSIRPGDSPTTESGAVALVIRTHWEQLRDDDLLDPPNAGTGPTRRVHVITVVATLVLLVATVLSFTL
ncbi:PH domain-containing protein [Pseudolysinimonas sp.]